MGRKIYIYFAYLHDQKIQSNTSIHLESRLFGPSLLLGLYLVSTNSQGVKVFVFHQRMKLLAVKTEQVALCPAIPVPYFWLHCWWNYSDLFTWLPIVFLLFAWDISQSQQKLVPQGAMWHLIRSGWQWYIRSTAAFWKPSLCRSAQLKLSRYTQ